MAKQFNIDDLVWAKMKGYPPWPGKVINPPETEKPKKNFYYVYFFGTENYAWVQNDCIQLHSEEVLEKYSKRKGAVFQKAIKSIVKLSNDKGATATTTSATATITSATATSDEDSAKMQESEIDGDEFESFSKEYPAFSKDRYLLPDFVHGPNYQDITFTETEKTRTYSSGVTLPKLEFLKQQSPPPPAKYIERPKSPPFDFNKSADLKKKKITPTKKMIGFLGFSKNAQGILKNLAHSGHSILLWHNVPNDCKIFAKKLQIKIASNPTEVVKTASLIFCCASDAEFIKAISGDILKGMEHSKEKKGYIEMTPMEISECQAMATEIRLRGAQYLEVASCGSRSDANEGTLFLTTAGDKMLYDECKSCLDAISKHHMFVDAEEGTASKYNHVFNMFQGTTTVALAESMSMLKDQTQRQNFVDVLKVSDLNYDDLIKKASAMVEQNYETDTPLREIQRSFTAGLTLGHEGSQHTRMFAMANEMYKRGIQRGYGDHDVSAVFEATKPSFAS